MNINTITTDNLRHMEGKDGLILQGCGGDLKEWVDGINEMFTEAGILKDGSKFEDVSTFQYGELTCLLYPFEDVKLDIGKLAMWRLQTHDTFGGTWLSDFVPNRLGGFIGEPSPEPEKPDCALIGQDGNIFNLIGIAARTLREHDLKDQAKEMKDRVFACGSYGEALCIIGEYVNITDSEAEPAHRPSLRQQIKDAKHTETPQKQKPSKQQEGKVFCTDCGRSLHRQRAERRKGPDTYWFHCLTNSRVEKDSCKGAMIQEKELISTVTDILEKELTVALGMSLPLFQLEARQKQEKDKLKIQMSAKRQEIEKTRRLIRGLYENFVQAILTNDEYFELKADYEHAINALSGEIEVFEKSMDSLDNQLARYRAMEKDAKTLAQDHVLTAELIERLIERIEIDHERNIHVTFRFKNEFQGKAVEPCATM